MSGFSDFVDVEVVASPTWYELAVMVNDGSGSMTLRAESSPSSELPTSSRSKGEAVDAEVKVLLDGIRGGRVPQNFHFAFVTFNEEVTSCCPPRKLLEIPTDESFEPTQHGIGGTAIFKGLEAAAEIVEAYLSEGKARELPVSAVVALMSDGEENRNEDQTRLVANRICQLPNTDLAACLFATHGEKPMGTALLESIVSDRKLYQRAYDTAGLRKFFHDSITARRGLPAPKSN